MAEKDSRTKNRNASLIVTKFDSELMKMYKYIAIKVTGTNHFIWFEVKKIRFSETDFEGFEGWGVRGTDTTIVCSKDIITAVIYSNTLDY